MKRFKLSKKVVFFSFFTLLAIFGMHKVCRAVFSVLNARWYFDERLSDLAQKSIIRYSHNQDYNNFSSFSAKIQKQFPVIKSLTMCQDTTGVVTIKVESITPKVRINDKWIVDADGVRVRSYFFDDDLVQALPTLQRTSGSRASTLFFSWLKNIPVPLLKKYNITWADEFHVWLQDKKEKRFVLLSSAQQNIIEQLEKKIACIKSKLIDQGAFLYAQYSWIADVRFKNHIIVSRKNELKSCHSLSDGGRGVKNGTCTS
ncbi:hypothetical protein KC460_03395 [Candidatus Dependentiae bacterium]|nr:hypothetical protein [Candidatus Dependentiae bacterium]